MKQATFTKSEQQVLDAIDTGKRIKKWTKFHDRAIDNLKSAGIIIIKGPDDILIRKEVLPAQPFTKEELNVVKKALYSYKVSGLSSPRNNEIWAEASGLELKVETLIRLK